MVRKKVFDKKFIYKIANLSKIELTDKEADYFSEQFNKTLSTIDDLKKLNTKNVPMAYNITRLKNVFREDKVDNRRVFSQEQALSNAKRTHNGYFVVKGVLDEK